METKSNFNPLPQHQFALPLTFEKQLSQDKEWGMSEASLFLEGRGIVHETVRRVCKRLNEADIPYAVAGGIALFQHGYKRFTSDVDLLVTSEGLARIHAELEGLGYVRIYSGSKNMRDAQSKVRIDFLVAGQFPGDGKPKPVVFPRPEDVAVPAEGLHLLKLETLIELKLASGLSNPDRAKDLVDVQSLIQELQLSKQIANELNPYVRDEYVRLWYIVNRPRRFIRGIAQGELSPEQVEDMQAEGVVFEPGTDPDGPFMWISTMDVATAHKHEMHDELQ